jgi:malonyl-CoA O-methyltransferase
MLEQRYLEELLTEIPGRHVLDAGCGSGRWLANLSRRNPDSLHGIDGSSAMLQLAAKKDIQGVSLHQCSCDAMPFAQNSFDLVLSSFVLSYIDDLSDVAAEIDLVSISGCDLFLSDMHPETQRRLRWKRSFRSDQGKIELYSALHSLSDIVDAFCSLGRKLYATVEPEFGETEREVFAAAGHLDYFLEANGFPAIYLLHLRKPG